MASNVNITKGSPEDYRDNPVRLPTPQYAAPQREYHPQPVVTDWRIVLARSAAASVVYIVYSLWKTSYCWSGVRYMQCESIAAWEPRMLIGGTVLGGVLLAWHYAARIQIVQAQATRTGLVLDRWGDYIPADLFQRMDSRALLGYIERRALQNVELRLATAEWERLWSVNTLSGDGQTSISTSIAPMLDGGDAQPLDAFDAALAKLPRLVDLEHVIDAQPGTFSVPFGQDHTGAPRWLDMRKDMLHVGIFGASGAGKDNLLESWFVALALANDPSRVQFVVLDGKGHWLKPSLAQLQHMWIPPAGGIGDEGQRALQSALVAIQTEASRRGKLIFGADCDTMERYIAKTGDHMPYLVVMISDVMGNIIGDVDRLLVDLVSKARALGIRVIVSLQTPTKQNTQWRTNLSTVLAAQMQQASNDGPALGMAAEAMQFPPSRLPNPKGRPGIFSVRSGQDQFLIQSALVRDDYFAHVVADLPRRSLQPAQRAVAASAQPSATVRASVPSSPPPVLSTRSQIAWYAANTDLSTRAIRERLGCDYNLVVDIAGKVRGPAGAALREQYQRIM